MDLRLRGRSALVTGGSKGIGAAAAEVLAEEGCHLHLAARDKAALDEVAERLRAAHGVEVTVHPVDLRRPEGVTSLAEAVPDIDILINNAGDIPAGSLDEVDERTWRDGWELKVFGYINLTRLVYARMKARGHGVIINDIGAAGERVDSAYIAGSAGNAALMAFTRALGGRSLRDNIRVVGINPGPVETERIAKLIATSDRFREAAARFPLGRPAMPREIADMMAFLASDRSAYTSGVIVTIDGGLCAGGA
ncbi:SDR family oxidoreductase [Nonomuraea guangzhouensis]|uniref:SDR family oxidoreductase n=1 Tax=Nonomuraea guangzhouensis TaxID=1291555 RepID=A0ABW4GGW1_9ACTN|nr:SDR family oxidoreductase [Nonomuraea guangzhouensis]